MAVTPEGLLERFPEFTRQPSPTVLAVVQQADRETSEAIWGDLHDDATYWLAAHLLAVRIREVGMFTGATPAKQYAAGSSPSENIPFNLAPYASTLYGQEFMRLEQSRNPLTIGFVV